MTNKIHFATFHAGHSVIKVCEFDSLVKQSGRFLNSVGTSGHAAEKSLIKPSVWLFPGVHDKFRFFALIAAQ